MTDEQRLEMALRQGALDSPRPALVLFPAVDDPDEDAHESYARRYGAYVVGYVPRPGSCWLTSYLHTVGLVPSYFERNNMARPAPGDTCVADDGSCDGSCGVSQ